MGKSTVCLVGACIVILWCCCISHVASDASDHRYKKGDSVPFYANKVGPFHNPSETYRYFDFPFCSPDTLEEKKEDLGEVFGFTVLLNVIFVGLLALSFNAKAIVLKRQLGGMM